jgi:hypothetical protein
MPTHTTLKWNFLFSPLPIKFILPFLHMALVPNNSIKPISRIPVVRRGGEQESEYLGGKTPQWRRTKPTRHSPFHQFPYLLYLWKISLRTQEAYDNSNFHLKGFPFTWNFSVCFSKISSALRTFISFPS